MNAKNFKYYHIFLSSIPRALSEHKYNLIGSLKNQKDKPKIWKTPQTVHKKTMIKPIEHKYNLIGSSKNQKDKPKITYGRLPNLFIKNYD